MLRLRFDRLRGGAAKIEQMRTKRVGKGCSKFQAFCDNEIIECPLIQKNKKTDANVRDKNKHYIEDQKPNSFIKKLRRQ